MFLIILACVAVTLCAIATVVSIINKDYARALLMFGLCLLNLWILSYNIDDYKHKDEPKVHVVPNVIKYQVDSTTMINGADTTKTYVLTYWDYEI